MAGYQKRLTGVREINLTNDGETKTAIVNSSTFGENFEDLMERLRSTGPVDSFQFKPDVGGGRLAEELEGYQYAIASVTPDFPDVFFENNDELKLIARHGIGCDNVDLEAATEAGVIVTRVAHAAERDAVAELTLSLIMTCIRDVIPASKAVEEGQWERRKEFVGKELSGMSVGIIGYGNIGSRVGEIINEGFGSEVSAYDPNIADAVIEKTGAKPASLEEVLQTSDLLSFNASLNEGNYHFIGEEEFELMKDGVVIVNTARGELMEESALVSALESGKVKCAGVDVLEEEPPGKRSKVREVDNLYILPHVGSYTERSLRAMDEKMVEDIETLVKGAVPDQVVNPKVIRGGNRAGVGK
ncbi:MAG: D-isomer specific 2-hydroxyacid dehydrogenase family protein [Candidatus Bipolaricaulota bacterium]